MYLFLSPHLDDAVLSCGGYIHQLAAAGERVVVATFVTADLPAGQPLTWLMRRNHQAWRLAESPFAARCREDDTAVAQLGAQRVHFGQLDAMYRRDSAGRPLYAQNTVNVPVHPEDQQSFVPLLQRTLATWLQANADHKTRVICPLAAGKHVDHTLVRASVEALALPQPIWYYEDYPYADQPQAVQAQLDQPSPNFPWHSQTIGLTPAEIEARIAAIACYGSQIAGLFPSAAERAREILLARLPQLRRYLDRAPEAGATRARMAAAVRAYIARAGGERYWYCAPTETAALNPAAGSAS